MLGSHLSLPVPVRLFLSLLLTVYRCTMSSRGLAVVFTECALLRGFGLGIPRVFNSYELEVEGTMGKEGGGDGRNRLETRQLPEARARQLGCEAAT